MLFCALQRDLLEWVVGQSEQSRLKKLILMQLALKTCTEWKPGPRSLVSLSVAMIEDFDFATAPLSSIYAPLVGAGAYVLHSLVLQDGRGVNRTRHFAFCVFFCCVCVFGQRFHEMQIAEEVRRRRG